MTASMPPPPIVPDDKNWTWVLERPCPECGFDGSSFAASSAAQAIRENAAAWPELLASTTAQVRPQPDHWSALEYGCHVRDVYRLYLERLELMLSKDDPQFANWDQDATAVTDRYDLQLPQVVADELVMAAEALAARFDEVAGSQWQRPGRRSDGAAFTVDSFARYLVHDPVHHLVDVRRGDVSQAERT
jgi:DinB superfamily